MRISIYVNNFIWDSIYRRFWNAANMAVMYLLSIFNISAINSNCRVKFNIKTSKFTEINKFFTVNTLFNSRFGETTNLNDSFPSSSSSFALAHPIIGTDPPLSPTRFGETMNLNDSFSLSGSCFSSSPSLSPCSSLSSDHRLHHSRPVMFSVGADPPLSPDLPTDFKQQVAATFHCFSQFFTTFTATNPHIHPGLTFLPFRSPFSLMSPGLLLTNQWPSMLLIGPSFHCLRWTRFNLSILLLMTIGGIEVNPGLSSSLNLTFGLLNTRSVVNKAPRTAPLPNRWQWLVLPGTDRNMGQNWRPPVIKSDPAPPGYRITHVHRDNPDQTRGGGLA